MVSFSEWHGSEQGFAPCLDELFDVLTAVADAAERSPEISCLAASFFGCMTSPLP